MIKKITIPRLAYLDYCNQHRREYDVGDKMLQTYVLAQLQSARLILLDGGYDFWESQHVFLTPEIRLNSFFLHFTAKNIEAVSNILKIGIDGVYLEVESPRKCWVRAVKKELKRKNNIGITEEEVLDYAYSHPSDDEIREMSERTSLKLCTDTRVKLSDRQKGTLRVLHEQYCMCVRPRDDESDRVASSISALLHRHSCFDDIYDLCKACETMDYGFGALSRGGFKF